MNFPVLNPEKLNALASVILALAAFVAGIWTVYHFRKTRRLEAAKWLRQLFSEFYIESAFFKVRSLLEYHYEDALGPLIEHRITNRDIPISSDDINLLRELDTLLNYFEFILYLEHEGHLSKKDRKALFEYWYDLLNQHSSGGLRRYIARFGFERIATSLNIQSREYVAFYGSLMTSMNGANRVNIKNSLVYVSSCKISGMIFDIGEYPGLIAGDSIVYAELHEVLNLSVFRELDAFEHYYPNDNNRSLYTRRCIRLAEPGIDAWVYFYNQDVEGKPLISSGNWEQYTATKT